MNEKSKYIPRKAIILLGIVLIGLLLAGVFSERLENILYEPLQKPDQWLINHPYYELGNIILGEPSSTLIVLILTVVTLWIGVVLIRTRNGHLSRFWWGLFFLLTGIGAGLAGVSYQAFGFELKCRGYEFCVWTSWWEVSYMICTVAGVCAAFVGIAYALFSEKDQIFWSIYALSNTFIYVVVMTVGILLSNRFLVSFELLIIFISIGLVIMSAQILLCFNKQKDKSFLNFLWVGAGLVLVITAYYLALVSDFAELLWERGIWFNQNDVLHVLMIIWVLFAYKSLAKDLQDGLAGEAVNDGQSRGRFS